jgi:hypothetical protein
MPDSSSRSGPLEPSLGYGPAVSLASPVDVAASALVAPSVARMAAALPGAEDPQGVTPRGALDEVFAEAIAVVVVAATWWTCRTASDLGLRTR